MHFCMPSEEAEVADGPLGEGLRDIFTSSFQHCDPPYPPPPPTNTCAPIATVRSHCPPDGIRSSPSRQEGQNLRLGLEGALRLSIGVTDFLAPSPTAEGYKFKSDSHNPNKLLSAVCDVAPQFKVKGVCDSLQAARGGSRNGFKPFRIVATDCNAVPDCSSLFRVTITGFRASDLSNSLHPMAFRFAALLMLSLSAHPSANCTLDLSVPFSPSHPRVHANQRIHCMMPPKPLDPPGAGAARQPRAPAFLTGWPPGRCPLLPFDLQTGLMVRHFPDGGGEA